MMSGQENVRHIAPPPAPQAGDVIVRRLSGSPARFVLHVMPRRHQFLACATNEEATTRALAFAERELVSVWYAGNNRDVQLIRTFRRALRWVS
jgi:hypothetical protein